MGTVYSVDVVVDPPVLDEHLGLEQAVEAQPLRSSSRSRRVNDSIQAFCHGERGSMKIELTPLNRHQSATA